jgi:hypothetical protein
MTIVNVPKAEMLHRVGAIVERLRLCSAYCGREFAAEAEQLEQALTAIEEAHAANVDTYLDGLYRRHNEPPPIFDALGMTVAGRWNRIHFRQLAKNRRRAEAAILADSIRALAAGATGET